MGSEAFLMSHHITTASVDTLATSVPVFDWMKQTFVTGSRWQVPMGEESKGIGSFFLRSQNAGSVEGENEGLVI